MTTYRGPFTTAYTGCLWLYLAATACRQSLVGMPEEHRVIRPSKETPNMMAKSLEYRAYRRPLRHQASGILFTIRSPAFRAVSMCRSRFWRATGSVRTRFISIHLTR